MVLTEKQIRALLSTLYEVEELMLDDSKLGKSVSRWIRLLERHTNTEEKQDNASTEA